MNMSLYDMIYVITNTFGVYIIYKFMTVFFDRKNANTKVEMLLYIGYFLIVCAIYLFVKISIIIMISNIILFFLLSLGEISVERNIEIKHESESLKIIIPKFF